MKADGFQTSAKKYPSPTKGKVLVLGSDTRAFLSVIRSLGRAGLAVHVAGCPKGSISRSSRYISAAHDLPDAQASADEWREALASLMMKEGFDLVIPCDDPTALPLDRHRSTLANHGRIAIPGKEAFAAVTDKQLTYELAVREGVAVPRAETVTAGTDAKALVQDLGLPLVFKPRQSFTLNDLSTKQSVKVVREIEGVVALLGKLQSGECLSAQEHFQGRGVGVEILAFEGESLFVFQHERLHEPLDGGGSSYRRSVALTPDLADAAIRLLRALRYTGVAMVEFKVNVASGRWVLMEINGRFWGSLPLAVAAGADFPRFLYEMLVEGRRSFPKSAGINLYGRNLVADLGWMRANLYADRRDPLLMTRPLAAVAGEIFPLLAGRERWDTFTLDDPRPAAKEIAALFGRLKTFIARKISLSLARFPAIQRYRNQRLRSRLLHTRNIHFVCKGNICRSPYAERYLARRLPRGFALSSSGYYPTSGRPAPATAISAAAEFGVMMEDHRSRVTDETTLQTADVILVFDSQNLRIVRTAFPQLRSRIFRSAY